ncbi:MAG: RIP metalloprotease RseP [Gemmatimonadota bacterium]|nr:RIP metalloprotease RseP [Gemmatimonadota bacterium]
MLTLVSFLVVIGVLIFVHELGHLLAAKAVDIEAPQFSIGFGPKILGFRMGETEYVISALPLGGYVRMAGMEDTSALEGGAEEEPRAPSPRDFDAKPLWARAFVISAGVIMNLLFAILTFAGIAYTFGEQINPVTRVMVVDDQAGRFSGVPEGASIVSINGQPVESWNAIDEALMAAPGGELSLRFDQGSETRLSLPSDPEQRQEFLRPLQPYTEPVIGTVTSGSPAAGAGLMTGDRVVQAGDQPVATWTDFVRVVRANPGVPVPLVVQRGADRVTLTAVPEVWRETDGAGEVGRLGVAAEQRLIHQRIGLGASLGYGVRTTWGTATTIVRLLGDLFTGRASPRSLGGPLAIGQISAEAARLGLEPYIRWMALLSVNLAVLNLLPIPVLDGGQLLFILVEAVRGRPLSIEQRLRLSHIGLILVVGLMVWAITNDFLKLFGI